MSNGNPETVCSSADNGSFLLPSLGFATADQAAAEALRLQAAPTIAGERLYQPISSGRCHYLPRVNCDEWGVNALLRGDTRSLPGKPI